MPASGNSRDVKMTLSVETLGSENIKKLQTSVSQLAKEGGDAAPEFQRLADEIGRIGQQSAALNTFKELAEQTALVAQRQEQTAATAAELRTRLEGLSAATQEAVVHQRGVAAALVDAQQASRGTRDALATLTATTDRAGKSEESYAAHVTELKVAKIAQRAEIERLRGALAESNAEVQAAEQAESQLATAYNKSATAAANADRALSEHNATVQQAATSAESLGVSTRDIAASQAQMAQGLDKAQQSAAELANDITRLADRERELEGIRAFDVQVQAANRLQQTAEYTKLFDQAIENLVASERELEAQNMDAKWQRDAESLVEATEASQRLAHETAVLEAAQAELAAQRAFEKQATDAKKMLEAASYVKFWTEALDQAEVQERQTAESAQQAGQQISNAFRTLGVRSADELQAEILQVRAAMETVSTSAGATGSMLSTAFTAGKSRIAALELEIRKTTGTLTMADKAASLFKNSLGQIAAGNIIADGVGYLVNKVKELGAAFVSTIADQQQMRRALNAVYKDTQLAASQFQFLRKVAMDSGVSIGSISDGFTKFAAAAKASGIPLKDMNDLFQSVTLAAGSLGLRGEDVTGMLEALQQMASKGTVSMEELRQQLGDRLPGALGLTAKGLGLTQAQLIKLVENGGLAARDLFPALAEALKEMHGEVTGLIPEYAKLKNVLTLTAENAGDSMWAAVLTKALQGLTIVAGALARVLSDISAGIEVLAKGAGILAGALVTLTNPTQALGDMLGEVADRQVKFGKAIDQGVGITDKATEAQIAHVKALETTGIASAQASMAVSTTGKAQQAQAEAARLAADGTARHGSTIVQLKAFIDTLLSSQTKEIEASGKLAAAARIEGDSLVKLTELQGQQNLTLQAQVDASDKNVDAMNRVTEAHRAEMELLTLKRDEIIKDAQARGLSAENIKVEIDAINQKIVASSAETEKSRAVADALKQENLVRRLALQAYQDNSASVAEYAKAVTAAQATLDAMVIAQRDGLATDEDLRRARENLTKATYLYNDSVKDGLANLELEGRLKASNNNLAVAGLKSEITALQVKLQAAKVSGSFYAAVELEIQIRLKKIEVIKASMAAQQEEIKGAIRRLEIERDEIKSSDPLFVQKRAEIEIRLNNAKAKLQEAGAGKEQIAAIEAEIKALRDSHSVRDANGSSIDADTSRRDSNTGAIDRQTGALQRQAAATGGGNGAVGGVYDPTGIHGNFSGAEDFQKKGKQGQNYTDPTSGTTYYKNSAGETGSNAMIGSSTMDAFSYLKARSKSAIFKPSDFTDTDLQTAKAQFYASEMNSRAGWNTQGSMHEARTLIDQIEAALAAKTNAAAATPGATPSGAPTAAQPPSQFPTRTVNVNVGGRTTAVNVASQDDSNALVSVLRQLETASKVAS